MSKLHITVILGTVRQGRQSEAVAKHIAATAKERSDMDVTFVDTAEYLGKGSAPDAVEPKFAEIVEQSDGFVIVSPEYNHSFPGSLKTLLDSTGGYNHKAVALAGVSAGPWGGTRVVQSLVPVMRELGLAATSADMFFPVVQDMFDESGAPKDPATTERIQKALDELVWLATALKNAR